MTRQLGAVETARHLSRGGLTQFPVSEAIRGPPLYELRPTYRYRLASRNCVGRNTRPLSHRRLKMPNPRSCSHFANGGAPFRTGTEFARIKTLQDRDHAPIHFAVGVAHCKKWRNALLPKIVLDSTADSIQPFGLRMRCQQSERFMTVRVNPSGKGVKTASERSIGMDAAARSLRKTQAPFSSRVRSTVPPASV